MSDAGNIGKVWQVQGRLVHFLWSRILHYMGEARNLSAEIHRVDGQEISLVFGITPEDNGFDESDHGKQLVQNLESQSTELNSDRLNGCTVLVANVPPTADEEVLELLFESKKKGGGPVRNVHLNSQSRWAIIEFCEPDAVDNVMGKLPIVLMGTELDIHRYSPSLQANEVIQSLKIHGLPKELTEELLTKEIEEFVGIRSDETASAEYCLTEDEMAKAVMQTIADLDPVQLKMLTASKYSESISNQHPSVKVKIDLNSNTIILEGPSTEIETVRLNMYIKLSTFSVIVIPNISEERINLYQSRRVCDYIKQKLNIKRIVGVWEVRNRDLVICSHIAVIVTCSKIVRNSLKEEKLSISTDAASTFLSQSWETKQCQLKGRDILCKVISGFMQLEVIVVATVDKLKEAVNEIRTFLDLRCVY